MAEMWEDLGNNDEFALPGDEELLAATAPPDPAAATPAVEPEPVTAAPPAASEPAQDPDRPRSEDGKFISQEEADRRAAAAEPPPPEGELILGKFKTQDDLERSYQELERRFHEGRSDGEGLAELAAQVAALREEQAHQPQPQYDPADLEAWFDENPTQIPVVAVEAHRQGNTALRDMAIAAWEDVNKVEAKRFEREVIKDEMRQSEQAHYSQAETARAQWQKAAETFAESHPDFAERAQAMMELAPQYPDITKLLVGGTEQVQQQVLDFLYTKAQARTSDNLSAATRDLGREQALAADEAIREAAVASTSATATAEKPSPADQIAAGWDNAKAPLDAGWNV